MGVIVNFHAQSRSATTLALFGLVLSSSLFAGKPDAAQRLQQKQTGDCIEWLVNGEIQTSLQLFAQNEGVQAERTYPLPYVLNNLGLSAWIPAAWNAAAKIQSKPRLLLTGGMSEKGALSEVRRTNLPDGSPLISLGEGRGSLVPLAVTKGLNAYGLDPANDPESGSADKYLARNWMNSLAGDARNLIAFADQSQRLVVSHDLLTQLNRADRVAVLRESFRVLEVTGTARHSIIIPNIREATSKVWNAARQREDLIVSAVQGLLKEALGEQAYQYAVIIDEPQFRIRNSNATPLTELFDFETDASAPATYRDLRDQVAPLEAPALNLLIVLRRPDNSWFSWEGWAGI
jgi:ubiquinone/menaquinone biosynthesis C-methylase UbiE